MTKEAISRPIVVALAKVNEQIGNMICTEEIFLKMEQCNDCIRYNKDKQELQWVGLMFGEKID